MMRKCGNCKKDKDEVKEFSKNRKGKYNKTCDSCLIKKKQYKEKNKVSIKKQDKQYRAKNKEKRKQYNKQWYKEGKHLCLEHKVNKYICKICNPKGHLTNTVRSGVHRALKRNKSKSSIDYLGISILKYKSYIEYQFKEGMTWDNYGEWQIDHIIPLTYKVDGKPPTIQEVIHRLHFTNTQPLWAHENLSKGNKFIG